MVRCHDKPTIGCRESSLPILKATILGLADVSPSAFPRLTESLRSVPRRAMHGSSRLKLTRCCRIGVAALAVAPGLVIGATCHMARPVSGATIHWRDSGVGSPLLRPSNALSPPLRRLPATARDVKHEPEHETVARFGGRSQAPSRDCSGKLQAPGAAFWTTTLGRLCAASGSRQRNCEP